MIVIARLAAVGLAALACGCGRSSSGAATDDRPVGVTVYIVRTDTIRDVASAPGVIVPSAAGEWTILAPEAAQVVELPKKEGDPVAIGDLLVRFEIASLTQELAVRQLAVTEAQSRVDRAKAEFARLTSLFERGITPRNTYEAARAEQTTAETILSQSVAQLGAAAAQEGRAVVRARFPGTVVKVWHAQGDFVSGAATDPVLQVVDPSRLQVAVQLPIAQLARILPGQSAAVRPIDSVTPLAASVALKPAAADPNAPTGEVRLAFADPSTLATNTAVSVEILLDQRTSAIIVPTDALLRDDISSYVVVAGDDRRAHRRDVRTGLVTRTFAQVLGGLTPGERVIVGGLKDVEEGTPIAFVE
jgi:RND family efflux transporter MFP subunit